MFQIVGFDFNYSPDPLLERPLASDILHHRLAPPDVDSADMFENYYEHKDVKAFVYIFDLISQLDVTDSSERRFAKWIRERVLRLWTEKNRKGMFVHIKQRKVCIRVDLVGGFLTVTDEAFTGVADAGEVGG